MVEWMAFCGNNNAESLDTSRLNNLPSSAQTLPILRRHPAVSTDRNFWSLPIDEHVYIIVLLCLIIGIIAIRQATRYVLRKIAEYTSKRHTDTVQIINSTSETVI